MTAIIMCPIDSGFEWGKVTGKNAWRYAAESRDNTIVGRVGVGVCLVAYTGHILQVLCTVESPRLHWYAVLGEILACSFVVVLVPGNTV